MVIVAIKRVSKYANNFYDQEQSDVSTKKKLKAKPKKRTKRLRETVTFFLNTVYSVVLY
jgi:Na+-transporting methylmalonyl-CoA/oxaloacetate decarboxylase gamma subunit